MDTDDGGRDIASLLEWVSQSSIDVSPRICLTSSHSTDGDNDYGVVLLDTLSNDTPTLVSPNPSLNVLLELPRPLVLSSRQIYDE